MTIDPNGGGPADNRLADHDRDVEHLLETGFLGTGHRTRPAERDQIVGEFLNLTQLPEQAPVPSGDRIGDALRRISATVARHQAGSYERPAWWHEYNRARKSLNQMARQAIARPKALNLLSRFASRDQDDPYEVQAENTIFSDDDLDTEISGALLFGYLLHLAGHPVSASFWWKIAAGAGDRNAAFAMHLHHLQRGEMSDAAWWFVEACGSTDGIGDALPPSLPAVPGYHRAVPAVTEQQHGGSACSPVVIAEMVNNLVVCGDSGWFDEIAERPDRRIAPQLADLVGHC
ncbi:hypothetical protein ACIRPK_09625 [Kitasatospora sp. NPDC101801]|uniref:hypothetical protein n=1 Tax=Kitasatospora sp. NPDC101801 TaxID=3364103 RepID=UPI00381D9D6A